METLIRPIARRNYNGIVEIVEGFKEKPIKHNIRNEMSNAQNDVDLMCIFRERKTNQTCCTREKVKYNVSAYKYNNSNKTINKICKYFINIVKCFIKIMCICFMLRNLDCDSQKKIDYFV